MVVTDAPVVVELFTSQSCSSCPPADRLLSQIADQENIIALGCHVEYWDHLHWKDTLSQDFCDMRQHGYSSIRGSKRVYTPQMIVNGKDEFVGSHKSKLSAALKRANQNPLKPIQIETSGAEIAFTLPDAPHGSYRLWAFGYADEQHQKIPSGENRGKAVDYANPVRSYTNLGSWDGQAAIHKFSKPNKNLDGIAILAQKNGFGEIVAAGKFKF